MIEWTKEMRQKLADEYATKTNAVLAAEMGITVCALVWKAKRMELVKRKGWKTIDWTEEKLKLLRDKYPVWSTRQLARQLGVSRNSVSMKAREMGLKKATKSEKDELVEKAVLENFGKMPYSDIARENGVSVMTIIRTVKRLGLAWSEEDMRQLMSKTMTDIFHKERIYRSCRLAPSINRTFGFDKSRMNIEYRLAEDGYFLMRNCDVVYYLSTLKRHPVRERHAEEMGMVFMEYPEECLTRKDNEGAQAPENLINSSFMLVTGIIKEKGQLRSGNNGHNWTAQDYVLETEDEKPQQCVFSVLGDNIAKFNIQKGERVSVEITMTANKVHNKELWFASNRAVNVTRV